MVYIAHKYTNEWTLSQYSYFHFFNLPTFLFDCDIKKKAHWRRTLGRGWGFSNSLFCSTHFFIISKYNSYLVYVQMNVLIASYISSSSMANKSSSTSTFIQMLLWHVMHTGEHFRPKNRTDKKYSDMFTRKNQVWLTYWRWKLWSKYALLIKIPVSGYLKIR